MISTQTQLCQGHRLSASISAPQSSGISPQPLCHTLSIWGHIWPHDFNCYPSVNRLPELPCSVFCYLWSTCSEAQVRCLPYFQCLHHPSTHSRLHRKQHFPLSFLIFINVAFKKGAYHPIKKTLASGVAPNIAMLFAAKELSPPTSVRGQ